ncbi:dienelactone hydrolase family protein [Haloarchaeobius sp. DFWS5]|uniref:dienelactone hydrolase family protein n=1 Tax=Haloarchaeobius sp. DFWS5 TaxID=3446114 RepID=UPI003EB9EEDC
MAVAPRQVVDVPTDGVTLQGELFVPTGATGVVLFAHGSGSSRRSPRNNAVAATLREEGFGTFLFDLLTLEEDRERERRFDIPELVDRLVAATRVVASRDECRALPLGYFSASTGAAAALCAAAECEEVAAIVSRGGRVDLAREALDSVQTPTLLVVGGDDENVYTLNRRAFERLDCEKELAVVPGAGHLFEQPGALDEVTALAVAWYDRHFQRATERRRTVA